MKEPSRAHPDVEAHYGEMLLVADGLEELSGQLRTTVAENLEPHAALEGSRSGDALAASLAATTTTLRTVVEHLVDVAVDIRHAVSAYEDAEARTMHTIRRLLNG